MLAPACSLDGINKDVVPFGFMLVLRELWPAGELRGVFFVGSFGLSERFPCVSELPEHLL